MFLYRHFYVARPVFFIFFCSSCVKKSRACRRCWCICMWMIRSTMMLSSALGRSSTVSLLPILGGWARRARWWCRVQHSQAWTQRMLTFAFPDRCRERKNLLFHMLVLIATLPSTHRPSRTPLHPLPFPSLNQMALWTLFTMGYSPRCRLCPSASPFCPVSFLCSVLAQVTN